MIYTKSLTLILSILLLTSFKPEKEDSIRFRRSIGVVQTCNGEEVILSIEISTESDKTIKIHSFLLEHSEYTIFENDKEIATTDTLRLRKSKPLQLTVKYKIQNSATSNTFNFKTNLNSYLSNQISIVHGQYSIRANNIEEGKEQIINVTESCHDSIQVFFPYGGTISGVDIYTDSTRTVQVFESLSYGLGEGKNFMTFTKADVGRYFVSFGSCHWGGEFWLTIK